jgi:hypothetical protein
MEATPNHLQTGIRELRSARTILMDPSENL